MLHILLALLKIIGFVLLAIFLLILALGLIVLLVAVRYRLDGSYSDKKPDFRVKVTWFLHLVSVNAVFRPKEGPLRLSIRILGIPLGKKKKEAVEEAAEDLADEAGDELSELGLDVIEALEEETQEESEESGLNPDGQENEPGFSESTETDEENFQKTVWETEGEDSEEIGWETGKGEVQAETQETSEENPRDADWETGEGDAGKTAWETGEGDAGKASWETGEEDTEKTSWEAGKSDAGKASRKREETQKKTRWEMVEEVLEDEDYQHLFQISLRQLKRIFRHLLPRKLDLYLHFGFADPSLTGKLMGAGSLLLPWYGKHIKLEPEFEEEVLEGEIHVKGRIRLGTLLARLLRLLFTRGFWKLLKLVLRRSKKESNVALEK